MLIYKYKRLLSGRCEYKYPKITRLANILITGVYFDPFNFIMTKYSKKSSDKVEKALHEMHEGKLKSGSGKKVKSRKQAIAIGLSEAREEGAKVPKKKSSDKSSGKKKSDKK